MSTIYMFLFVIGLIILPIATSFGDHQNSFDETKTLSTEKKNPSSVPLENKAIVKRRGPSPPPLKPNPNQKRAHKSPIPPARKDHPPGTHSPAGSSTAGGSGVGVGRRYTSGGLGAGVH
ncbi:hypothetical protein ABFX02_07G046700 [Erythranthe guttata]